MTSATNGPGNVQHTWGQVVNALVSDAADPTKFQNIRELTGKERNIVLKALQNDNAPKISPEQLNTLYSKLTTSNFKRESSLTAKISRALQNMVGMRISATNFSQEVLKSQRVVKPLSGDAMDVITDYLTRNLKSRDIKGNLHTLTWKNTPQGMKAKIPAGHTLNKGRLGMSEKLYSEKIEDDSSSSVIVSKYKILNKKCTELMSGTLLGKELSGGSWLDDWAEGKDENEIKKAIQPVVDFIKTKLEKFAHSEVKRNIDDSGNLFEFPGKKPQEIQQYLEAVFPDFDDFNLTENDGTTTLEISYSHAVLFKEFQMQH